ncbi:MAG: hypothetical protein J6J13_01825 [Clostridia bacterium]|nr:hypothetical protein [Clostridia bacterium]
MEKRNEEYVPQFDLDNVEEKKIELKKCIKCGKPSVSLHDGCCFECRRQEKTLRGETIREYYEKQDKNKSNLRITTILAVYIVICLLIILILADIIPASETLKKACYKGLVGAISAGIIGAISWPISKLINYKK